MKTHGSIARADRKTNERNHSKRVEQTCGKGHGDYQKGADDIHLKAWADT